MDYYEADNTKVEERIQRETHKEWRVGRVELVGDTNSGGDALLV